MRPALRKGRATENDRQDNDPNKAHGLVQNWRAAVLELLPKNFQLVRETCIDQLIADARNKTSTQFWVDNKLWTQTLAGHALELRLDLHLLIFRKLLRAPDLRRNDSAALIEHCKELIRRCSEIFRAALADRQ